MFVSHPPALPLLPPTLSISCSLPPSPPSKGRLHHLFLPAGHIFCFFVFFFYGIRESAVKHLILLTTSDRPAAAWDTVICGRRGGGYFGGISEAVGGGGVNLGSGYLSERTRREQGDGVNSSQAQRRRILFHLCLYLIRVQYYLQYSPK